MTASSGPSQAITRLVSLPDALVALDGVKPVAARQVPVAEGAGYVLAADIIAPSALPQRPQALYDGFAVRAEATFDASTFAPVLLTEAVRVVSGETIPDGADAVLSSNDVQFRGDVAEAVAPVGSGEGILAAGGDCAAGAVLRRAGSRLRPSDVAALTIAGITAVEVRAPRVCIGCARESHGLRAAADMLAHELQRRKIVTNVMLLEEALHDRSAEAVIGVGGTGEGTNDGAVVALRNAGRIVFHGLGLIPGETAGFGFVEDTPVLLLPGRLDATLAAWRVLGERLTARLCAGDEMEMTVTATLQRKVTSTVGMAEFVPLRIEAGKAEPLAAKYLPLSVLTDANGWILVPPSSEGYQAGTSVLVRPWH